MKRYLIAGAAALMLSPFSAGAKPEATKQVGMTSGVRAVFDAASMKPTIYGSAIPLTFSKDDADKMLEIVANSPKPVTIELWTGDIPRGATSWDKGHKFLGNSGATPALNPSFKWMITPGNYTALVLTTMPPGSKPDPYVISYGKEIRVPTEQDKKDWNVAVAKFTVSQILQSQAKRQWAPNFSTLATDRNPISPQQYRGKVLLIQFISGTDTAVMEDLGFNQTTFWLYHSQGYDMICVFLDTDQTVYDTVTEKLKPEWRQIFDATTGNAAIADKYGVQDVPDTVLIDVTGRVVSHGIHREQLRKLTIAALAEARDYKAAEKLLDETPDAAAPTDAKPADDSAK